MGILAYPADARDDGRDGFPTSPPGGIIDGSVMLIRRKALVGPLGVFIAVFAAVNSDSVLSLLLTTRCEKYSPARGARTGVLNSSSSSSSSDVDDVGKGTLCADIALGGRS